MSALPGPLAQKAAAGQVVLFLGALVPELGAAGGFPGPAELAQALAQHCQYPDPDRALPRVAQYCQVMQGREALIAFLQAQLADPAHAPAALHRQVARLPLPVIITTCYDTLLEAALRDAGHPYTVVTGDDTLPYAAESETLLIKMLGSIEQAHTLVITEDDYLAFSRRLPVLSAVLTAYFATRTLLFLCHDLEDAAFKQLYVQLVANLGAHARHAYAVLPGCTPYQVQYWAGKGLHLIDADPLALVEALAAGAPPVAPPRPTKAPAEAPLPKRPFKFLDYYDTADAAIFFGRQRETRDLTQLALGHRLVVLTGASGTGKTSLVRAGVVPLLDRQDCLTAVVRVGDDPVAAVIAGLRRMVPALALPAQASLVQAVQAAEAESGRVLVIIIDQFEEFFVRLGQPTQECFIEALAACLDDASLGTRFVLSLRSDFFVHLQALRSRIPGIFHNTYEVQRLTPPQARQTIAGPLQAVGLAVDPGLVDRIVTDLDLDGIDPPQLQIVCDRLYQAALDAGSPTLTTELYQRLGGAERILNEYLDDVLARLPQADYALAREILKALVTAHDTKDRRPAADLAQALGAPAAAVTRVADDLVSARLLRRIDRAYEPVHDYLVRRVRAWLDEGDRQLKEVQEMLRREVDGWRTRRLSLSRAELRLIATCSERDRLRPTPDELALIAYSAVLHDMDAGAWLARVAEPRAVLLFLLDDEDPVARQRAAARLADYGAPGVGETLARVALTDPDQAARQAAARSLGQLGDAAGLAQLAQATQATETRGPALAALAQACDAGAPLPAGLDRAGRRRVLARLAGMRVWRARVAILYEGAGGALGGALGLSLGFALLTLARADLTPMIRLTVAVMVAVLFTLPGLVAGGVLALLSGVGAALSDRRAQLLGLAGAMAGGALGYGLSLLLLGLTVLNAAPANLFKALLSGLFLGAAIGAGVAVARWLPAPRRQFLAAVGGGLLGGLLAGLLLDWAGLLELAGARMAAAMGAVMGGSVGLGLGSARAWLDRLRRAEHDPR